MLLTLGKLSTRSGKNLPYLINGKNISKARIVKNLDDKLWDTGEQLISSAKTSRPQIPSASKKINFKEGSLNADLGGGKFDLNTDYLKTKSVNNLVYDPFNRTKEHNINTLKKIFRNRGSDSATSHNVLNVIQNKEDRLKHLTQAKQVLKKNKPLYISVYEKKHPTTKILYDNLDNGSITKDGWQNNANAKAYLSEVEEVFGKGNVSLKNKIITAYKRSY